MDAEFVNRYAGNILPTRAIYPARYMPYVILLATSKFARSCGIYLSYDLLKLIHVIQLLFFIKAGSAICFMLIQKPLSGRRLTKRQWFRVGRHAVIGSLIHLLWLYGLALCGPLRTLLMFEHSDHVLIAVACALFTRSSSPARFRGALLFLAAFLSILLFDHDLEQQQHAHADLDSSGRDRHASFVSHIIHHLTYMTGLSDHTGGVVLLLVAVCTNVGYNTASKSLSVDIGGGKRLHALSTAMSACLLLPWTLFILLTRQSVVESWSSLILSVSVVSLLVLVYDYYIDAACTAHLDATRTGQLGTIFVLVSALLLSAVWNHPFVERVASMLDLSQLTSSEHQISGGVVVGAVMFAVATYTLTQPVRSGSGRGSLVGYSAAGPPLYNFAGDALQRTSQSVMVLARSGLRQILDESDSRRIFYFLCINLSFTFIELIYGVWTNSLGLISDGFHMFFDCSALVMGLYAAVMCHWKATRTFSFGYDRVEILSGFINALFLIVIAFFVFAAALVRLLDPPTIRTERLLFVSVAGFFVNLIGIMSFRHNHSHHHHGHSHNAALPQSHGCPSSTSHSHAAACSQHSHSDHPHSSHHSHGGSHAHSSQPPASPAVTHNTNMEGVFLHVLADTLGSVGVIVSTLLIQTFGWNVADPICSLFIAALIFVSVLPLVKETALILLLRTPEELQLPLAAIFHKLLSVDGVISYSDEYFWRHSSRVLCGTIHIQLQPDSSEQKVVSQVTSLFKEAGISNMCIQVEKRTYFRHLQGLGVSSDRLHAMTHGFKTLESHDSVGFVSDL